MTEEQRDKLQLPIELTHKILDRYLLYSRHCVLRKKYPFRGDSIRLFKLYSPSHQALLAFYAFTAYLIAHPVYKQFKALAPWAKSDGVGYIDKDPMWKSEHVRASSAKELAQRLRTRSFVLRRDHGRAEEVLLRITLFGPKGFIRVDTNTSLFETLINMSGFNKTVRMGGYGFLLDAGRERVYCAVRRQPSWPGLRL